MTKNKKKQEKSRFFGGFRINTADFNIENQDFHLNSMKSRILNITKGAVHELSLYFSNF